MPWEFLKFVLLLTTRSLPCNAVRSYLLPSRPTAVQTYCRPDLLGVRIRTVDKQFRRSSVQRVDKGIGAWVNHATEQTGLAIEHEAKIDGPQQLTGTKRNASGLSQRTEDTDGGET